MRLVHAALSAFVIVTVPHASVAAPSCHTASVEQLGRDVAEAFAARAMAALAARLPNRPVRLHVEHSLSDEPETLTIRLRNLDRQIARRDGAARRGEPIGRQSLEGMNCSGLVCRFGPSGILHNNLYLKELAFVRRNGCLTVSRIHLLDGD